MSKQLFILSFTILSFGAGLAQKNDTNAGTFTVEHPTLLNLGFEWSISGDENRNATVEVQFRAVGESTWRGAMPLVRIGGERIFRTREHLDYTVPDGFAGSILNVQPGTEYECKFEMSDPDGVQGKASQTVKVTTRTVPKSYTGGDTIHVYPADFFGPREEPNATGILQAYYGAGLGDWSVVWEKRIKPGDILLLHAGLYRVERLDYVDPMMTPFDGLMSLTLKGTPEKPITIKAAGDGEVIIDGDNNHRLLDVMASEHHIFENLTFRNTDIAIYAGQKEVAGAIGLTVKNCRFENVGAAVWTEYAGSSDFYIADNLIIGRDDRFRLIGWGGRPRTPDKISFGNPLYKSHLMVSYYGIKVYGPGHVIAHNSIAYFHDAIGVSTYGSPESDPKRRASSIDIYGNDMHMMNDDFIETDGSVHNVRVFRNRGVNAKRGGFSAQPVFGGPIYFYRNIAYNVPSGISFKFSAKPAGLFVFNNTLICEQARTEPYSNAHWRNNLFLGRDMPGREIMIWPNATEAYSSDYNGFRPNKGVKTQYKWFAPAKGSTMYERPKPEEWQTFETLTDMSDATGHETHGMEVDYDIFEHLAAPNPNNEYAVHHAMDLNFNLKPDSKPVDAGVVIPTLNENFKGEAPDLGAIEVGAPPMHYGPRWLPWQPFYR
ncbi:MAG: hypothetical protein HKN87_14810 [Saprospiraceae bacterium]|nr:hypothetical protein [Saprospiraceae bacterium]